MKLEVEMKLDEKAFRVDRAICPSCGLKIHKIIENKNLFECSLTFHIIKLHCEKCGREYLDLEQAQVYDLFLIFDKAFRHKPLADVTKQFPHLIERKL